ncbi:NAD(P)H-dependent flavin oxidoreductase [Magnetospirillum gryphiswaldense]|uniref:Dioxygenases related to 2-nitropropane dioxygenase n=1 Tax=Magnetospirillum gryphiswaldense TaxID=55518 RepID=A4U0A5_9PROT|nr:nitronate monooxygenase [Magnetospirillum gryphiswaldense]AVM75258.1 Nitronate monooxygenase [Magnetospirillum gryphiswaldense MSR-1]AVM79161.1 Nitronate monooxygenase [Magnetospirillum gryphiswaldense]CAM76312.1 Dioxygenases related to 2-nitropropane dioxygenase [Magnetospirillum gryphiswaldense MSR-1]
MFKLDPIVISGREVLPLVEGGKGINVSNGESSGAWAAAGGVATFSGVNADNYDENGNLIPMVYHTKTRSERHGELIAFGIKGAIAQARIAHDISGGNGRLHMNVLWEMGGAEEILEGALEGAKGLIHGVTCGAGMPYRVAEIAAKYGVYYYPIVSSARAFRALWKRAYHKYGQLLGGVVYEDPWLAGGHNGLSNSENPEKPEPPYARVRDLRATMRECGVSDAVPVFMAGGVWALKEWSDWIGNPELGAIAFQFGTRPLLTQESPISDAWKHRLLTLKPGDVLLHRFSPTGFYSSAVKNDFITDLVDRSHRQIAFSSEAVGDHVAELPIGARKRIVWVTPHDKEQALAWMAAGFTEALRTPDNTLVFVDAVKAEEIRKDQVDCMGCLSQCAFSNWAQNDAGTTGKKADPRSFCIQKTLQNIGHGGDVENELMFAGHNAYRFANDPFYAGGFIPTVRQLVDRMATGE